MDEDRLKNPLQVINQNVMDNAVGKVCGKDLTQFRAGGIKADRTGGLIGAAL